MRSEGHRKESQQGLCVSHKSHCTIQLLHLIYTELSRLVGRSVSSQITKLPVLSKKSQFLGNVRSVYVVILSFPESLEYYL